MGILFEKFAIDLILLLITIFTFIYVYFMYCYTYWERRHVPYIPPKFPLGNAKHIRAEGVNFTGHSKQYYNLVKEKGLKYGGIYILNRPILILRDPEYIKDILTKDFESFPNRTIYFNEHDDPISAHLFAIRGSKWKNLRNKLTPTFTSGKMKTMFPTVVNLCTHLTKALDKAAGEEVDINISEYTANFTTDVICNVAFGLDSNTFENPNSEFRTVIKKLEDIDNIYQYISQVIIGRAPSLASKLRLIGTRKDVSDYFHDLINQTISYRKLNGVKRPDVLQLLNDLSESTIKSDNPFTFEDIVAQSFLYFFAGSDTSSSTMYFTLYELSRNQDIQDEARKEIKTVLENHKGELTYESLNDFIYLQQIIDESQRLYPPILTVDRVCEKEYQLRNSNGTIGKGVTALIPILSLHRDPEYYPDPEKFDPERFSPENRKLRHPYLHLPFGEGPRNCIGSRFGLMQVKVGLVNALRRFRFTLSPLTKPVELVDNSFTSNTKSPIYLKAEKL